MLAEGVSFSTIKQKLGTTAPTIGRREVALPCCGDGWPYMASDDPDFEGKAADIIGLYLSPPQHAAVFCVEEKTAIQALDRLDPVLPFSPGRAERHGFEYYRHEPCRCMRRWTPRPAAFTERPLDATPAATLSSS
jgi:hypothetical protein